VQAVDAHIGIENEAGALGAAAQREIAALLDAEEDVLGHRQRRRERDLLVDERDPGGERLARRRERDGRATQPQLALVGADGARDDLAERRLAGSVLADERVHAAGTTRHMRSNIFDQIKEDAALRRHSLPQPCTPTWLTRRQRLYVNRL
jgi:hypothetical protein